MSRLKNIPIKEKLQLFAIVLFFALGMTGLAGYRGIEQLSDNLKLSHQYFTAAQNTLQVDITHDGLRMLGYHAVYLAEQNDETGKLEVQAKLQEAVETVKTLFDESLTLPLSAEIVQSLTVVRPLVDTYVVKAQEIVTTAVNGKPQEARIMLKDLEEHFLQLRAKLETINSMLAAEVSVINVVGMQVTKSAKRTAQRVLIVTLLLIFTPGFLLARSITKPLAEITAAAVKIAQGNVQQQVTYESQDEMGALASAFRDLIQYFRTVAGAADAISKGDLTVQLRVRSEDDILSHSFLRMVETLRHMSGQMQESTRVLAAAIEKIVSSTQQLVATTTQAATSVAETATTVEEVKQTAQVSNHKAQEVSGNSHQTLETSQHGQHSVEEALTGMNHVRSQMESIAQRVAELGTQTQTIGDIITTVNTLAEQSHLLAINAAIEAAKAGDAGKGFAVVAQEIRGLADQSKRATAEVQKILTDIRRAADTAVLVTRQGTQAADLGAQRSLQAGESIRALTQNVTESAQALSQIAISSQQQLVGMDRVVVAMRSIRQASTQSVEGLRKVETAALNLQAVGYTLKALVEQFVVTTDEQQVDDNAHPHALAASIESA